MCRQFKIARKIADEFIMTRAEFRLEELYEKIAEEGGLLRVSSSQTLSDYLEIFENLGLISYSPVLHGYKKTEFAIKREKLQKAAV